MDLLKIQIKDWEHSFIKNNGRNPTKSDIKQNNEISLKYKQYRNYRINKSNPLKTPTKAKKHVQQLETPQKTSPLNSSPPIQVHELGPTPQLNGRVLSIFDVSTSPSVTPTKQMINVTVDDEFALNSTPSKKSTFSSRIMECYGEEEDHEIINSELEHEEEIVTLPSSQSIFKTPQKNNRTQNFLTETPSYLTTGTKSHSLMGVSPSPLASQRMKKGLTKIIDELNDIKSELKYGDFDRDELVPVIEEEEELLESENGGNKNPNTLKLYKKNRTQKRQTRRVKMKARKDLEVDEMKDKNVHDVIQEMEESKLQILQGIHMEPSSSEEESDSEEEVYVRQKLEPIDPKKMKERKNFVKLKINKKKKMFGKRGKW